MKTILSVLLLLNISNAIAQVAPENLLIDDLNEGDKIVYRPYNKSFDFSMNVETYFFGVIPFQDGEEFPYGSWVLDRSRLYCNVYVVVPGKLYKKVGDNKYSTPLLSLGGKEFTIQNAWEHYPDASGVSVNIKSTGEHGKNLEFGSIECHKPLSEGPITVGDVTKTFGGLVSFEISKN